MLRSKSINHFFESAIILLFGFLFLIAGRLQAQEIKTKSALNEAFARIAKLETNNEKIDLLIEIGAYYLNLPGELKADLSTAMRYQNQALTQANQISYRKGIAKSLILKANIARESGDKLNSEKWYNESIDYAAAFKLINELAAAYSAKGQLHGNEGAELDKKIKYNERALKLYQQSGNKLEEGNSLNNLGDYYNIKGQASYAIKLMDSSVLAYKSAGYGGLQGVYNNLCIAHNSLGNLSEALKYGLLAERTAEKQGDTSLQRSSINNHLGLTYFYLRNDKKALDYWYEAERIAEKYKDPGYILTIVANMTTALVRMKRFDEGISILTKTIKKFPPQDVQMKLRIPYILFNAYYDIQEYRKAEPYYKQILKFHQDLPKEDPNQIYLYRSIIKRMVHEKQYEQVIVYLKEHEKQSLAQKNVLALSQLHRLWYNVDSALNKPWSAIAHYKEFKRLADSIYFNEKNKQLAGLEIEYQTEKKDKDIALLNQKNQLQKVRIASDDRMRFLYIGGLVLLVLFAGLVYNRYRLKKKSNLVLEQKQKEINEQNKLLRQILDEKEWLLREIHHRVKNNLQIVISLLNTQSAYLDNADALIAIRNSQNRMHAMSLIHQKLYQSDNLAEIDMDWYIKELVDYMVECFSTDRKIQFELHTESIRLDVAQAVPLGLILNEAISNTIKYAFPDGQKGKVSISFLMIDESHCELRIADNGVGLPADFDVDNTDSLGMSLMTGLTVQLNGEINMWNDSGMVLNVKFKKHNELSP